MKRFAQQFKRQSDKIKLSAEEQFLLREKITTFMEYHPLPSLEGEARTALVLDNVFKTTRISWKKMTMSFGIVTIAFVITLPTVAEYTVPGDMLYPVKVKINEEVRGTLARTSYEKVEWEAQRIERRISEARILAKAGLLTPEVEEAVADAVEQHSSNASAEIALLRENNNTDDAALANMTLASVFEVQSTTFKADNDMSVAATFSANTSETSPRTLAGVLEGERAELARLNETSDISYGRLMAEIEKQTTRAYERLSSIKDTVSPQEASDIDRRLNDIATRINVAKEQPEEGGRGDLRDALRDTQMLITFMNDIDVRSTVAVEQIVPIIPTFEERLAQFNSELEELVKEVKRLTQIVVELPEDSKKEAALISLNELELYIEKATAVTSQTIKEMSIELLVMQEKVMILGESLAEVEVEADIPLEGVSSTTPTTTSLVL